MSLERLTKIYGLNQKSDQKMAYSITPISCVMWMTFFVSKNEEKRKKEKALGATINNIKEGAVSVLSMVISPMT